MKSERDGAESCRQLLDLEKQITDNNNTLTSTSQAITIIENHRHHEADAPISSCNRFNMAFVGGVTGTIIFGTLATIFLTQDDKENLQGAGYAALIMAAISLLFGSLKLMGKCKKSLYRYRNISDIDERRTPLLAVEQALVAAECKDAPANIDASDINQVIQQGLPYLQDKQKINRKHAQHLEVKNCISQSLFSNTKVIGDSKNAGPVHIIMQYLQLGKF